MGTVTSLHAAPRLLGHLGTGGPDRQVYAIESLRRNTQLTPEETARLASMGITRLTGSLGIGGNRVFQARVTAVIDFLSSPAVNNLDAVLYRAEKASSPEERCDLYRRALEILDLKYPQEMVLMIQTRIKLAASAIDSEKGLEEATSLLIEAEVDLTDERSDDAFKRAWSARIYYERARLLRCKGMASGAAEAAEKSLKNSQDLPPRELKDAGLPLNMEKWFVDLCLATGRLKTARTYLLQEKDLTWLRFISPFLDDEVAEVHTLWKIGVTFHGERQFVEARRHYHRAFVLLQRHPPVGRDRQILSSLLLMQMRLCEESELTDKEIIPFVGTLKGEMDKETRDDVRSFVEYLTAIADSIRRFGDERSFYAGTSDPWVSLLRLMEKNCRFLAREVGGDMQKMDFCQQTKGDRQ